MTLENVWPSIEDLNDYGIDIDLAPYGVISQYAESIFNAYDKKLIGNILLRSKIKSNGDKTDFVYSLVISQTKEEAAQIKILEIEIEDDGWYPAKVYLTKPNRELIGIAENEKQLRKFIVNGIKSDFVKKQIAALLK